MLVNDSVKSKNFHTIIWNIFSMITILGIFLGIIFVILTTDSRTKVPIKNNFHVILNSNFGYADKGFSQQAVEGVCASLDISAKDCDSQNEKFKSDQVSYGFPNTMENPTLIQKYVDNFIHLEHTNNFVLPGFSYNCFLFEKINEYQDLKKFNLGNNPVKKINFIAIDTSLDSCRNDPDEYQKVYPTWPKNLYQINFKHYLAGYHAGLYAGMKVLESPELFKDGDLTTPGKQVRFGILGGLWIPPIKRYSLGFAKAINTLHANRKLFFPETEVDLVLHQYLTIGGFNPLQFSDKAKKYALTWYRDQRISIIFNVAVSLTKSIHLAAKEIDIEENDSGHNWVIGVDIDQGVSILNENPDQIELKGKILVSATLAINKALEQVIRNDILTEKNAINEYVFSDENFISIPKRFKQTELWKKLVDNQKFASKITLPDDEITRWEKLLGNLSKDDWWKLGIV